MRILALVAPLFLVVGVPGTSAALTSPLDSASTFIGNVGGELLGPGRTDGFPTGGSMGTITFDGGSLEPNSTVQVTSLHFSQDFTFGYACNGNICFPGFDTLPVTLDLEGPGSVVIDAEGQPSGEIHVIVSAEDVDDAATLIVSVFGYPITPGALTVQGTLQFDNPESPLANLQGVVLVPEPSIAAMLMIAAGLVATGVVSAHRFRE